MKVHGTTRAMTNLPPFYSTTPIINTRSGDALWNDTTTVEQKDAFDEHMPTPFDIKGTNCYVNPQIMLSSELWD